MSMGLFQQIYDHAFGRYSASHRVDLTGISSHLAPKRLGVQEESVSLGDGLRMLIKYNPRFKTTTTGVHRRLDIINVYSHQIIDVTLLRGSDALAYSETDDGKFDPDSMPPFLLNALSDYALTPRNLQNPSKLDLRFGACDTTLEQVAAKSLNLRPAAYHAAANGSVQSDSGTVAWEDY